ARAPRAGAAQSRGFRPREAERDVAAARATGHGAEAAFLAGEAAALPSGARVAAALAASVRAGPGAALATVVGASSRPRSGARRAGAGVAPHPVRADAAGDGPRGVHPDAGRGVGASSR